MVNDAVIWELERLQSRLAPDDFPARQAVETAIALLLAAAEQREQLDRLTADFETLTLEAVQAEHDAFLDRVVQIGTLEGQIATLTAERDEARTLLADFKLHLT